jgi:signal transduction histidine kinase/DNA-binding response OmpR family regulator
MVTSANGIRPRDFYNSLHMIPLYLFGHHEKAIETGNQVLQTINELWSFRNSRLTLFYLSLSILARVKEDPFNPERENLLGKVVEYKEKIAMWQVECDVNYLMWSQLISAEMSELTGDYHNAIQSYEAAIDHTQLHDFMLEQAIAFELQGEFFIRRGARRAGRSALMDAIAVYSTFGASGKVEQLAAKHEWVLKSASTVRTADVGVQTSDTIGDIENTQFRIEEHERQETRHLGKETAGDRTKAWINPEVDTAPGLRSKDSSDVSGLGLDVLDLQSILEFNQAISSELQIDRLLAKMTQIILESAGASADFAGVVIEGEGGWGMAASGTPDGIVAEAIPLSDIQDETKQQVLLYTMRFKEAVFVHNVLNDDRFCNTPSVKSVISLPIIQGPNLLGVLYLEGQPNSFTNRNLGMLQLFCNQVGISIANALLFRRIRQVSASNTSMIESQKRALAKAREAEIKAKLAEAEAMRNVRLKEEAAKAKSMFLANVSHELRTPLNGVIGMSELLKATFLNQEQDGYADSIRVCADTLLTVINDILDFSKLEAGKMKLFSVPLNLKETITEVVRALSYTNLERGLQTIQNLDLDPYLLVMGDPVRLYQIFMNLLSNSYKFTAKGSVTVKSRTEYEDNEVIRVTCSVADTGIGITQEQISRLFKPFAQADSSTQRSYGGSGLGLSICKALINVLNGKIWLESQLGVGTAVSFTLTFPKAPKSATAGSAEVLTKEPDPMATWSSDTDGLAPQPSTAPYIDLSQIPREQLRICIAEDNPINQKIAVSFVEKLGFKSAAYSDGLQAVEAIRRKSLEREPFHLVLMDVQMPVLDGYDATRLIRKDDDPAVRNVLIIAMTASAIRGDREKCLQAGMNNYLAKPVRAAVLKSMLEDYLSQPPKPISSLQESVNDLAKGAIDEAQQDMQSNSDSERPTFSKRMSSRNNLPFDGEDPQQRFAPNGAEMPTLSASHIYGSEMPVRPTRPGNGANDSEETATQL